MDNIKDLKSVIHFVGDIGELIRLQTKTYSGERKGADKGADTTYFLSEILHHFSSYESNNKFLFELIQKSILDLINNEAAMKSFGQHESYALSVLRRGTQIFSTATALEIDPSEIKPFDEIEQY